MNDHTSHASDDASRRTTDQGRGFLTTLRRAARFGAGLLRAVAGAPAGVEQTRRGSFLVLVVATLALMSVFAVVYVTIGKTDAGTRRGVLKGQARDDVPDQLADYIVRIIGDDVFATVNLGVDNKGEPFNIREVTDYPGVNWSDLSDSSTPDLGFNPVGTYTSQWTSAGVDPRGASDPFLAASEPTYLGYNDDGTKRVAFDQARDWAAISNVAPDGAFVNLFNLRGNFGATPQQMRSQLTLLDQNGDPTNQIDFGGVLNFKVPAHLTNRQQGLFRPANTLRSNGIAQQPNSPVYLDYHYADADADHFYDSRWFEMVDAHDLSNIKNLLRTDDGLRYFFAVRVEDLSGRANVLTGMDLKGPPDDDPRNVIGVTPDVDLRRLLSLIDPLSDDPNDANLQLGYKGLQQPDGDTQAKLVENYANYLPGFSGQMSMLVGEYAYDALHNPAEGAMHTGLILPPEVAKSAANPFTYALPGDRTDLYREHLGLGLGLVRKSGVSLGAITSIEDLGELLTYRGINDPSVTSQLELIFGGRYRNKAQAQDLDRETVRFSPLRDNRSLALERDVDNRDGATSVAKPDGKADIDALIRSAFDVRQRITTLSGARPLLPTRVTLPTPQDRLSDRDLPREVSANTDSIFAAYADVLIPDSDMDLAWKNDGSALFDAMRFTNYGAASAELGARIAAHMTVNLKAALGGNSSTTPLAYTVLLDEDFRQDLEKDWEDKSTLTPKQIESRDQKWSWWVERRAAAGAETGALDIGVDWQEPVNAPRRGESRLGDSDAGFGKDTLESQAINVYAVTPQPVLTAAASFHVYTDIPTAATAAPYGFAGDQEWEETGDIDDPYIYKKVTIDPRVNKDNADFLMQVVAFQLTNPFDATIYLTQNGMAEGQAILVQDRFEYYIEFGGRYFRLANVNPSSSGSLTSATLAPGETRVFYVMCLPLESGSDDIVSRWKAAKATFTTADVSSWLDKQMGVSLGSGVKAPMLAEEFDPITGKSKAASAFVDLLQKDTSGPSVDPTIGSVRLWRALRSPSDSTKKNETPFPASAALPDQFIENDQLIDRLRDPRFDPADATKSTFAPRLNLTGANNAEIPGTEGGPDNITSVDPLDNTGFSITRVGLVRRPADPNAASGAFDPRYDGVPAYMLEGKWASGLLKNQTRNGAGAVSKGTFDGSGDGRGFDTIAKLMTSESTSPVLANFELVAEPRAWTGGALGKNKSMKDYDDVRVSFTHQLEAESLRVADLLLPLGIGPEFDPAPAAFDDKHLTLGEAIANALDYSSPTAPALYAGLGTVPPISNKKDSSQFPKLDRGHLSLDRFVPFYDGDNDGVYDRTQPADRAHGRGLPLALSVFDRVESIDKSLTPWGVDRAVIGRVNVNTASRTVLRSVGVLSPTPATSSTEWWWAGSNFDQRSDIATTVLAYRDKAMYWPRVSSPNQSVGPVDFRDSSGVTPDQFDKLDGREALTTVKGVRELPGMASVGEVMLAKVLNSANPDPTRGNPNNIDFLGYNKDLDFHAGVTVGVPKDTRLKDAFAERLAVAASATSALSTRSDFFAVWFIVRGYRESDVKGLADSDPMVPSVQRRFVMVVDRSNVVKYGQRPRVLLLKEVPF